MLYLCNAFRKQSNNNFKKLIAKIIKKQQLQNKKMVAIEIHWDKKDVKPFYEQFETYERAWKEFEYQCDKRYQYDINPVKVEIRECP